MSAPLAAAFETDMDLPDGYVIEWDAIDGSGNPVAGVVINSVSIFGTDLSGGVGGGELDVGPFMLVPGPGA